MIEKKKISLVVILFNISLSKFFLKNMSKGRSIHTSTSSNGKAIADFTEEWEMLDEDEEEEEDIKPTPKGKGSTSSLINGKRKYDATPASLDVKIANNPSKKNKKKETNAKVESKKPNGTAKANGNGKKKGKEEEKVIEDKDYTKKIDESQFFIRVKDIEGIRTVIWRCYLVMDDSLFMCFHEDFLRIYSVDTTTGNRFIEFMLSKESFLKYHVDVPVRVALHSGSILDSLRMMDAGTPSVLYMKKGKSSINFISEKTCGNKLTLKEKQMDVINDDDGRPVGEQYFEEPKKFHSCKTNGENLHKWGKKINKTVSAFTNIRLIKKPNSQEFKLSMFNKKNARVGKLRMDFSTKRGTLSDVVVYKGAPSELTIKTENLNLMSVVMRKLAADTQLNIAGYDLLTMKCFFDHSKDNNIYGLTGFLAFYINHSPDDKTDEQDEHPNQIIE